MSTATLLEQARDSRAHFTESRFEHATREQLANVEIVDLLDELVDAEAALTAAIAKGNALLIGRIVLAVRKGYAERLVNQADFGGALRLPGAGEVAAKVLAS